MSRSVAPVKVSPLIKTARWTLLVLGIFYGANRLHILRVYEKTAKPKREQKYAELNENQRNNDLKSTINELMALGKEFEVTEFTPGWESDL